MSVPNLNLNSTSGTTSRSGSSIEGRLESSGSRIEGRLESSGSSIEGRLESSRSGSSIEGRLESPRQISPHTPQVEPNPTDIVRDKLRDSVGRRMSIDS